jgi:predicted nucleic acid-binding protein
LSAKEEKGIRDFLAQFRFINIDEAIKTEAVQIRKKYGLKLPDCIVAATSITLQLTFITADKQFKRIENLLLELYEL